MNTSGGRSSVTKLTKKNVKMRRSNWTEMWRKLKATIGRLRARVAELEARVAELEEVGGVTAEAQGGGGDCDDFCDFACGENGSSCDLSFGDPGACGALCDDENVYFQEEV